MRDCYVDTPQQLQDLCEHLQGSAWLALDTEFMREKTYYAQFCLLQIASENLVACIDPLALTDLNPLLDIIYDPSITKVMHAARQDLEIFYNLRNVLPEPLFDTQIAATVLGHGDQIGYAALVYSMLGVELDKSSTRTDWCQRPLDPKQLSYAADDVRYLAKIYALQCQQLEKQGRSSWLNDDFMELADQQNYVNSAALAWRRVKQAHTLKGVQLAVLRALAGWREERARKLNRPRKWIVSDDALLELARHMPQDPARLARIRGLESDVVKRSGADLIAQIAASKAIPADQWPQLDTPLRLDGSQEALVDTLMAVVRLRGIQNAVSPAALATRKELEALVLQGNPDAPILHGWRGALVGRDLQSLLDGGLSLRVRDGSLAICQA